MAGTEAPQSTPTNGVSTNVVNGAAAASAKPGSDIVPAAVGQRRFERTQARQAHRAQTVALLESGADEVEKPAAEPEPAKPAAPIAAKPAAPAPPAPVETDDGDDQELETKVAPSTEKKPAEEPAVAGGLAKIQAAEKHSRAKLDKERADLAKAKADFEREQTELKSRLAKYEELEKKAPTDPVAAMKALGIDVEYGAKQAWQHHLATKDPSNPQLREVAARMQKDREVGDELSTTKAELAAIKKRLDDKEENEREQQKAGQFFQQVGQAITASTDTPLLQKAMAKNPKKAFERLATITFDLHKEHGDMPEPVDVIATYERLRREELEELDLAPAAAAPTTSPTTPKTNHQAADKKQPAKTLGNDLSTPRVVQPRSVKSDREHRAETLRMLETGKLE